MFLTSSRQRDNDIMKLFQTFKLISLLLAAGPTYASPTSNASKQQSQPQPQSKPTQHSHNWAGAVHKQPPSQGGSYTHVSAAITIPKVTRAGTESYQAASIWVGIDGATASNAILQTGVEVGLLNGAPRYAAWYQWFPRASVPFQNFDLQAGDVVVASVNATSASSGICMLENQSTGQTVTMTVDAPAPTATLTGQNAEWIVEDFVSGRAPVPLVDFGEVTLEGCQASGEDGETVGLGGAAPFEMVDDENGPIVTVQEVDDSRVVVKHT